jgi:hypothetical protein
MTAPAGALSTSSPSIATTAMIHLILIASPAARLPNE